MRFRSGWMLIAVLGCPACSDNHDKEIAQKPEEEVAPQEDAPPRDLNSTYQQMADNALLADMTMLDYHFQPQRTMLTSLGEQRLSRLASLMQTYGGSVRFSTSLTDQALIDARVQTMRKFLGECGLPTTTELVSVGMAGGEGMDAGQAILISRNSGTYQPGQKNGAGAASPMGTAGAGSPFAGDINGGGKN